MRCMFKGPRGTGYTVSLYVTCSALSPSSSLNKKKYEFQIIKCEQLQIINNLKSISVSFYIYTLLSLSGQYRLPLQRQIVTQGCATIADIYVHRALESAPRRSMQPILQSKLGLYSPYPIRCWNAFIRLTDTCHT